MSIARSWRAATADDWPGLLLAFHGVGRRPVREGAPTGIRPRGVSRRDTSRLAGSGSRNLAARIRGHRCHLDEGPREGETSRQPHVGQTPLPAGRLRLNGVLRSTRAHNGWMRRTRLCIAVLALTLTACAAPSRYVFESGSAEDRAARYVAEWGGSASRYRQIFETGDCAMLAEAPVGDLDRDTRHGREATGYVEARRERMAELGCSEQPPPTPPE